MVEPIAHCGKILCFVQKKSFSWKCIQTAEFWTINTNKQCKFVLKIFFGPKSSLLPLCVVSIDASVEHLIILGWAWASTLNTVSVWQSRCYFSFFRPWICMSDKNRTFPLLLEQHQQLVTNPLITQFCSSNTTATPTAVSRVSRIFQI